MLALSGLWPGLSVHQARARPAGHGFVPDLILNDGDDASVKEANLQILLNHADTMTGSKHPANPPTIDLLDSDNDNNLQLTIFEFGSNTFKHLKHSNNSPDAASPVAQEFMVVASSHLGTTIPEPLPEFSHAVPDSEVLELSEVLEVL
ncbi:hypothetical protein V8E55_004015 [Tylopilus felleus]